MSVIKLKFTLFLKYLTVFVEELTQRCSHEFLSLKIKAIRIDVQASELSYVVEEKKKE